MDGRKRPSDDPFMGHRNPLNQRSVSGSNPPAYGRGFPQRQPSGNVSSSARVRDIVNWLESTQILPTQTNVSGFDSTGGHSSPQLPPQQGVASAAVSLRSHKTSTRGGDRFDPLEPAAGPSQGPKTEEYSLTLLQYKSYFNNRPLARRLDAVVNGETVPLPQELIDVRSNEVIQGRQNNLDVERASSPLVKQQMDEVIQRQQQKFCQENVSSSPVVKERKADEPWMTGAASIKPLSIRKASQDVKGKGKAIEQVQEGDKETTAAVPERREQIQSHTRKASDAVRQLEDLMVHLSGFSASISASTSQPISPAAVTSPPLCFENASPQRPHPWHFENSSPQGSSQQRPLQLHRNASPKQTSPSQFGRESPLIIEPPSRPAPRNPEEAMNFWNFIRDCLRASPTASSASSCAPTPPPAANPPASSAASTADFPFPMILDEFPATAQQQPTTTAETMEMAPLPRARHGSASTPSGSQPGSRRPSHYQMDGRFPTFAPSSAGPSSPARSLVPASARRARTASSSAAAAARRTPSGSGRFSSASASYFPPAASSEYSPYSPEYPSPAHQPPAYTTTAAAAAAAAATTNHHLQRQYRRHHHHRQGGFYGPALPPTEGEKTEREE